MKKIIIIIAMCLAAGISLKAQDYNWAIGVRGGGTDSGLTIKHILSDANAFEVDFSYWYPGGGQGHGEVLTAFYEWNSPIGNDNFLFFYGFGGHIGSVPVDEEGSKIKVGIDGIVGIEYKVPRTPIAFSLDYRPFVNLLKLDSHLYNGGLGIKFCF